MKTKSLIIVALMAAVLVSVPSFSFSSGTKGKKCKECAAHDLKDNKEAMHDKMIKDLNLAPAQVVQMETNRKTQMEQMKQLNKSMKDAQESLRVELDKPNTNMVAVEKLTSEIKSIEAKKIDSKTQGILDVKKILTPEQFIKMGEKMKKDFKEMKGKMGDDRKDEAMKDMPPPPMQEEGMDNSKENKDVKNNIDDGKKDKSKDHKQTMHDKMVKDLSLAPAQAEQMKTHRKTQMEQVKQLNKSMKEAQESLRVELDKPSTNMIAVEKLTSEIKSIEARKIDSKTQGILDVKKILTPEQFSKMCEKMKKGHKNMKGKMGDDSKDESMENMPPPPMQEEGMDDGKKDESKKYVPPLTENKK